jgi:uncharacterized protein YjbJ (UPF0337 family)
MQVSESALAILPPGDWTTPPRLHLRCGPSQGGPAVAARRQRRKPSRLAFASAQTLNRGRHTVQALSHGSRQGGCVDMSTTKGNVMNKDQVKGAIKDAAGKVQEQTGKLIGSPEQQVKGIHKQVAGQTQKAVGDVKEVMKDLKPK